VWVAKNLIANPVVCENSAQRGLRGLAVVELEHTAEPRTAPDRAGADRRCLGRNELVAQTRACFFHCAIWTGWTANAHANSLNVRSLRSAATATIALNSALFSRRFAIAGLLACGLRP